MNYYDYSIESLISAFKKHSEIYDETYEKIKEYPGSEEYFNFPKALLEMCEELRRLKEELYEKQDAS